MSIYARHDDPAPDADFEPGCLEHLVPGNTGRLLDERRTPVSVAAVRAGQGRFELRLEDFEDAGAVWLVDLEDVAHYQFARGEARLGAAEVAALEAAVARFAGRLQVPADPAARAGSRAAVMAETLRAGAWLDGHSDFLRSDAPLPDPEEREGVPQLYAETRAWFAACGLDDIEQAFAEVWVSNPRSGDVVRGHRVILAELGLAGFDGRAPRDPQAFAGGFSRTRRAAHVLARLGWVAALFARLEAHGGDRWRHGRLHRGHSGPGPLRPPAARGFLAASFSLEVARSHHDMAGPGAHRRLVSRPLPRERRFMTCLETEALNGRYREAEAVLLAAPDDPWF